MQKIRNIICKTGHVIFILCTAAVFLLNFLYCADVSSNRAENVTFQLKIGESLIFLPVIAAVLALITVSKPLLLRIGTRRIFLTLTLLYCIGAVYLIFNADPLLRADAKYISDAALEMIDGVYSETATVYIGRFPNQAGLVLYESLLYRFSPNPQILFLTNFVFVLGINFLLVKITNLLFTNRFAGILTTVMAFAFLPQLFFILFAYGTIPGLFFTLLAFYAVLKFGRTQKTAHLLLTAAAAFFAVMLRQNCQIAVMAMVLYIALVLVKKFSVRRLIAIPVMVLCLLLPVKLASAIYWQVSQQDAPDSMPPILWIAMATDMDNNVRGPGWWDCQNYDMYEAAGGKADIANEIGRAKLRENLQKMRSDPAGAYHFFEGKIVSQWCEPLYQSLWSGPLEDCGQYTRTEFLRALYTGDTAEQHLTTVMRCFSFGLWGAVLGFLLLSRRTFDGAELLLMYFAGGFLFHIFWEAKSQYIYPYVICLLPCAAYFCAKVSGKIKLLFSRKEEHQ